MRKQTIQIPQEEMDRQFDIMRKIRERNENKEKVTGRRPVADVRTFGCQMNEHDSEKITGMLLAMGYRIKEDDQAPDLVIFNTCCVRENAEEKVYGHLGALKKLKKDKPETVIAVCGCMTEQPTVVEEIKKKYKNVDLVFGTHNLHRFPELLKNVLDSGTRIYETSGTDNEVAEGVPVERDSKVKAWVTIMYGCDNFCTYCIVPYVRGRERSRRPEEILREVKELEARGIKEITLLGQNVNSYGKDLRSADGENTNGAGYMDFAGLLSYICENTNIPRIRFMTSHPKDLSQRLIDTMAKYPAICRQLHLPVQSGSTRLLKMMNRRYTKEQYLELVGKVREKIPDVTLSTDIIVGFPGETEEDFEETLDVVRKVKFDMAFTFIYSKRTGTPAATYPDQVPDDVVKDRFARLLDAQNKNTHDSNVKHIGETLEVLAEGQSRTNEDKYTGRTQGGKPVNFTAEEDVTGRMVLVKITGGQTWYLEGEYVRDV